MGEHKFCGDLRFVEEFNETSWEKHECSFNIWNKIQRWVMQLLFRCVVQKANNQTCIQTNKCKFVIYRRLNLQYKGFSFTSEQETSLQWKNRKPRVEWLLITQCFEDGKLWTLHSIHLELCTSSQYQADVQVQGLGLVMDPEAFELLIWTRTNLESDLFLRPVES